MPFEHDIETKGAKLMSERPWLLGSVSALIDDIKPAKQIIDEMVATAVERLQATSRLLVFGTQTRAKL